MAVRVVTDSTADIPPEILKELDIAVVPIYVVFGEKSYRDRVDIGEDEFYHRLSLDGVFPTTAVPSPKDFADVYNKLAAETDEIISVLLAYGWFRLFGIEYPPEDGSRTIEGGRVCRHMR